MGAPPWVLWASVLKQNIDYLRFRSALNGESFELPFIGESSVCPVCGLVGPPNAEPPWEETGETSSDGTPIASPSYGICPCCRTEFGNDDIPDPGQSLADSW